MKIAASRRALEELRRAYNLGRSLRWCFHAIAAAAYRIGSASPVINAEWIEDAVRQQASTAGEEAIGEALRDVATRGGAPLVLLVALAVRFPSLLLLCRIFFFEISSLLHFFSSTFFRFTREHDSLPKLVSGHGTAICFVRVLTVLMSALVSSILQRALPSEVGDGDSTLKWLWIPCHQQQLKACGKPVGTHFSARSKSSSVSVLSLQWAVAYALAAELSEADRSPAPMLPAALHF